MIAIVFLLLLEILVRPSFGFALAGSLEYVRHLTLWVAMLGAALAARDGRLLALTPVTMLPDGRWREAAMTAAATVTAAVTAVLACAAVRMVILEYRYETQLASIPVWAAQIVFPAAFTIIGVRVVMAVTPHWGRVVAFLGGCAGVAAAAWPEVVTMAPSWSIVAALVAAAGVGAPLYAVLGGLAVFLFMAQGVAPVTVAVSAYDLTTNAHLPAIPVFTLAGVLLAEGDTAARLLRLVRAWAGWVPGGTAVVCAVVCTFFTIFTGGSGVTILALGGLLLPALLRDGYPDRFSVGLLTGSGSLGLLLPPALPLVLYGIVARTPMMDLFAGGLLPGLLMLMLVAVYGTWQAVRSGVPRPRFDLREALASLWHGKWEVLLPAFVLGAFFGGYATLLETAALTALYALVVQIAIHRNIRAGTQLRHVIADAVTTSGGVLIILCAAVGLTSYLVDAEVPGALVEWTRAHVHSRAAFLLALNLFLLVVGCMMDIYSAIFIVVPLIVPLASEFGVHPVHLGIIFIANLELGYLTPPVGLNLFLASYRFSRPIHEICRASLPMLAILFVGVLLITYCPWLTTVLLPVP